MKHVNTVIIGGGQAGLAMGRCLYQFGVEHVILERGRIGERWRSERWDSLRMLTPNWQSRLPHWHYKGSDPDAFMTMPEFVHHLENYAQSYEAPVQTGTAVTSLEQLSDTRFRVTTDREVWLAANVVIATGFCDKPRIPEFAADVPEEIRHIVPADYRNPGQVPEGNVLVVGASATGLQIGEELLAAGREVTLAVGTHIRVPRRYRGRDILFWMDAMGAFASPANPAVERSMPPPQLIGADDNHDLDVGTLQDKGARLAGRAIGVKGSTVRFADTLHETVRAADEGMFSLLAKIDGFIKANRMNVPPAEPDALRPTDLRPAPSSLDLDAEGIRSIVWATGYRREYPWLKVPVLDDRGEVRHEGGITPVPGLYVLGMRFQKRKFSNLVDGVGRDAEDLSLHIAARQSARAA